MERKERKKNGNTHTLAIQTFSVSFSCLNPLTSMAIWAQTADVEWRLRAGEFVCPPMRSYFTFKRLYLSALALSTAHNMPLLSLRTCSSFLCIGFWTLKKSNFLKRCKIYVYYGSGAVEFYERRASSPIYAGVLYECHYIYTLWGFWARVYDHWHAQAGALSRWLANIKSRPLLAQQEGREARQVCVDSGGVLRGNFTLTCTVTSIAPFKQTMKSVVYIDCAPFIVHVLAS